MYCQNVSYTIFSSVIDDGAGGGRVGISMKISLVSRFQVTFQISEWHKTTIMFHFVLLFHLQLLLTSKKFFSSTWPAILTTDFFATAWKIVFHIFLSLNNLHSKFGKWLQILQIWANDTNFLMTFQIFSMILVIKREEEHK